jgi:hypothetical protein
VKKYSIAVLINTYPTIDTAETIRASKIVM